MYLQEDEIMHCGTFGDYRLLFSRQLCRLLIYHYGLYRQIATIGDILLTIGIIGRITVNIVLRLQI